MMPPFPPALQAPATVQAPDHAACKGFVWVASAILKLEETPVERIDLYLDPAALQKEALSPEFRDLPREEAAWRVLREARIPMAWRMIYLQDVGHAYHRAKLEALLRAHWPEAAFPVEHPVVRRFLQDLSGPRNVSDPAEVVLEGGVLRHRGRGGAWVEYHLRPLVVAIARSNLHLEGDQEEQLRRALASHLAGLDRRR